MTISDINALRYWQSIPHEVQALLLSNVYCNKCGNTKVIDYALVKRDGLVIIEGKCETCGGDVARVIDDD